jgi:hypothetical protein
MSIDRALGRPLLPLDGGQAREHGQHRVHLGLRARGRAEEHVGRPVSERVRDERRHPPAGVKAYTKQWGTRPVDFHVHGIPPEVKLRHPHGADPSEWPIDLRVRETPWGRP